MAIFSIALAPILIIIITGMSLKTDRPCYYTIIEPPGHYVACSIQSEWMYVILIYFVLLLIAGGVLTFFVLILILFYFIFLLLLFILSFILF